MGALYKGLAATGIVSGAASVGVIGYLFGFDDSIGAGLGHDRHEPGAVRARRAGRDGPARRHHRVLHRDRLQACPQHRQGVGDGPRHQRDSGTRRLDGGDRAAGHRDLGRDPARLCGCRHVRHRDRRHDDARHGRHGRRARRLRARHRQRRRHRRDGGPRPRGARHDGRARRGRQHDQGDHQGLRHRLGRARRARAVRRLHAGPGELLPGHRRDVLAAEPVRRRRPLYRRPACRTCSRRWA